MSLRKKSMEELDRLSVEGFKEAEKLPLAVVLDNVRSMHNVGSAFRTADAFRVEKLALCGYTARPPHRDIQKTALGATETVEWEGFETTLLAIERLKETGYTVVAVEQAHGSVELQAFVPAPDRKYAFVFGNEAFGVDDEALAACDMAVEIPQFGAKHSLNVSVSLGVVCWRFVEAHLKQA